MPPIVQQSIGFSRKAARGEFAVAALARPGRLPTVALEPQKPASHQWPVDLTALARCRVLLKSRATTDPTLASRPPQQSLMDVPEAYDGFCRSHFSSVRRVHPNLRWDDARPAYAVALAAHAVLCEALDEHNEQQLAAHWDDIRGDSGLSWVQARPFVYDGCRALSRLDPLAMHR